MRVRLYELKSGSTFGRADYFPLVEAADATLAGDLVAQDEVLVAPGAELQVDRTLDEQTRLIGLVVAYRELDRSVWRQVVSIPAQQRSQLKVRLDAHGVSASLTPGQ
ncbi:Type VI secretion lipoprotein [compost metagenome]